MTNDRLRQGVDHGGIVRDNVFHRRVSEVRNHTLTYDEIVLLELLNSSAQQSLKKEPNIFDKEEEPPIVYTQEDLERVAYYDDQTPVYNFRYLIRKFRREMSRSKRYNRPVSVVVVALDGMKNIAREYGCLSEETALMSVAEILIAAVRTGVDMVGRYGDDRFILVLPETPGRGAGVLTERIRKKLEAIQIKHQWYVIPVTASLGISYFPGHASEIEQLIAKADLAADMVQERGGNGVAFAPEET